VLRRYAGAYGLCLFGFLLMFLVVDFFGSLDDFLASSKTLQRAGMDTWPLVLRFYATKLPFIVTTLGPYMTLFAGIATLITFARHNELVPMIASGRSHHRVLAPVYAFAILVVFGLVTLEERVVPWTMRDNATFATLLKGGEKGDWKNPPHLRDPRTGNVINAMRWSPSQDKLLDVQVAVYRDPERRLPEGRLDAAALQYRLHPQTRKAGWFPVDGTVTPALLREGGVLPDPIRLATDVPVAFTLTPSDVDLETAASDPGLSRRQLVRLKEQHEERFDLDMRLFTRTTRPISSLVLLLLGLPFVSQLGRKASIAAGLGVALGTCAVYVAIDLLFLELGNRGEVAPLVAAWFTPALFGSLALARLDRITA
jgi:lipopolysaccharide export system permease protein